MKVCPFVVLGPVLDAQDARIRGLEGEVRDAKRRLTAEHEAPAAALQVDAWRRSEAARRVGRRVAARRRVSEDDVREAKALFDEGLRHRDNKKWREAVHRGVPKCVAALRPEPFASVVRARVDVLREQRGKAPTARPLRSPSATTQRCIALDRSTEAHSRPRLPRAGEACARTTTAPRTPLSAVRSSSTIGRRMRAASRISERQRQRHPRRHRAPGEEPGCIRRDRPDNDGEQG